MPRIRTIKPEFWSDEKIGPLDPLTRLVFLGLISLADDRGRIFDSLKTIDAFIFPYTDHSSAESLDLLTNLSRIFRYSAANGMKVIQLLGWAKHQVVDHPQKYSLPDPSPEILAIVSRESPEILAIVSGESRSSIMVHDPLVKVLFEEKFWPAYPKKTGKAKCLAWWMRKKPDSTLLASMLCALEWQKNSVRWTKSAGEFVPDPLTWLNGGRWEDDPAAYGGMNDTVNANNDAASPKKKPVLGSLDAYFTASIDREKYDPRLYEDGYYWLDYERTHLEEIRAAYAERTRKREARLAEEEKATRAKNGGSVTNLFAQ